MYFVTQLNNFELDLRFSWDKPRWDGPCGVDRGPESIEATLKSIGEGISCKITFAFLMTKQSFFGNLELKFAAVVSVTRLGDLLDFGKLFKAFDNNYFVQISHILRQFL